MDRLYNNVPCYFQSGTLDEFIRTLAILLIKNGSTYLQVDARIRRNDSELRTLARNAYGYFRPVWQCVRRDIDDLNKYSYSKLVSHLDAEVLPRIEETEKRNVLANFRRYDLNDNRHVSLRSQPGQVRSLQEDFEYGPNVAQVAPPVVETQETTVEVETVHQHANAPARRNIGERVPAHIWPIWETLYTEDGYYWSWKLNQEQYGDLKGFLVEVLAGKRREEVLRYSDYLTLYCAEWYKREYTGDGQGHYPAFESLGIHNHANLARDLVQRVRRVNLRGGDRYLYSLYIQGGLPWMYIVSNDNTNLARGVAKLFKEVSRNGSNAAEYAQEINNAAIRDSIQNGGSVYENIRCLVEDDEYVAYIQEQFPAYAERISNFIHSVRTEVRRNFSHVWRFDRRYVEGRQRNTLVSILAFTTATEDGVIPRELLASQKIDLARCKKFNLVAKSYRGDTVVGEKRWTYYRCPSGDYSTPESYDGRVIAMYENEQDIPTSIRVFIEDVPGPFGLRLDNGFDHASTAPLYVNDNLDLIKLYGDLNQNLLYSNAKDAQLFLLKRDFIESSCTMREVPCGAFVLMPISEPVTVSIRGHEKRLAPFGALTILMDSRSLHGALELNGLIAREASLFAAIEYKERTMSNIQLVSHADLSDIHTYMGDDEVSFEVCGKKYTNWEGESIEDIDSYYGLAKFVLTYGNKSVERDVYILDVNRDVANGIITLNGQEYPYTYEFQPENTVNFTVGNYDNGRFECSVYYPFDCHDVILTYPSRRVYRSPRFYEQSRRFYHMRIFDANGCRETIHEADNYVATPRPQIRQGHDGVFVLPRLNNQNLPSPSEFYLYNTQTRQLQQVTEFTEMRGRHHIVVPDDFRHGEDQCVVFHSSRNASTELLYRSPVNVFPYFDDTWWGIVREHKLLVEDWYNSANDTFYVLKTYYRYVNNNPDFEFLKNIASAKNLSWLFLGKDRLLEFSNDKNVLKELLIETSLCPEGENFSDFIDKYISNLSSVSFDGVLRANARPIRKIAAVLSGQKCVWREEESVRREMYELLYDDDTYSKLITLLNLN